MTVFVERLLLNAKCVRDRKRGLRRTNVDNNNEVRATSLMRLSMA